MRFVVLVLALIAVPRAALAFCGFYVSGADAKLFNNATLVVMMRDGTRTVLSMQNNYQGPPENFAMVVPVPVVLQKENVKTLPRDVFQRVDQLAAPRLVEYWEQDPCAPIPPPEAAAPGGGGIPRGAKAAAAPERDLGVKIEAQFTVGEYQVVILSAKDSTGLDTWLKRENYKIPDGAEPILRPYVQGGMKFFVAKVDVAKVTFDKGMAMLSPLRFHYDTEQFSLPVRLGLMNSSGTQDLIVHVLARGKRYEVANYDNVPIPTNIDVAEAARDQFGAFYAALFDRTIEKHPKAVVTEYAWDAGSCDPCPTPPLSPADLATLGADVISGAPGAPPPPGPPGPPPSPGSPARPIGPGRPPMWTGGFVLTRLHARYRKDTLGEDLVFREATAIVGGREFRGTGGQLETGAQPGPVNNFQGRYAIRHPWTGAITCAQPRRGIWGGPPPGVSADNRPKPALNLAFAPRGAQLASFVKQDVPDLGLLAPAGATAPPGTATPAPAPAASTAGTSGPPSTQGSGCGSCSPVPGGAAPASALALAALTLLRAARRVRHVERGVRSRPPRRRPTEHRS